MKVPLEHEDAPVLQAVLDCASSALCSAASRRWTIVTERFPVKIRLHKGWKGTVYNTLFVGTFNALPRAWVRPARLAPARVLPEIAS